MLPRRNRVRARTRPGITSNARQDTVLAPEVLTQSDEVTTLRSASSLLSEEASLRRHHGGDTPMDQSTHSRGSAGQPVSASILDTPNRCDGVRRGVSWIRNVAPPATVAVALIPSPKRY